jgi:demethylmenaquinone methyltransferase/2-methoxy-6-polyprenyl-1,4-benzoquinol methylase
VTSPDQLLADQLQYYRQRASEYDVTSFGVRAGERITVPIVAERLDVPGDVLELACGTGMWTAELARHASSLTALDGAPEMLELARKRVASPEVDFVLADVFRWNPERTYDVVFSAFFISHIPPERFADFWSVVARALRADGRAVMIDELPARAHLEQVHDGHLATRTLSDGSEHQIIKIFYEPDQLVTQLDELGWTAMVTEIEHGWFVLEATR